jgi:ribosomal protein S18 acetylase RimI-like enzyme
MQKIPNKSFTYALDRRKELLFREVLAEDKSKIKDGFALLSAESRYMRFFGYLKELSESQLNYLSHPDQVNHVAWGVMDTSVSPDLGVGVARFIRLADEPKSAELAITVIDSYQGQGIGNILFGILYLLAKPHQIDYFVGSVLPSNEYVLHKLRAMNANIRFDGNVYQFKIPICEDITQCMTHPSVARFAELLNELVILLNIS